MLIRINNEQERQFYEIESMENGWNLRELQSHLTHLYKKDISSNKLPEELPDFFTSIDVILCPAMLAIYNFIQPPLISIDPIYILMGDH